MRGALQGRAGQPACCSRSTTARARRPPGAGARPTAPWPRAGSTSTSPTRGRSSSASDGSPATWTPPGSSTRWTSAARRSAWPPGAIGSSSSTATAWRSAARATSRRSAGSAVEGAHDVAIAGDGSLWVLAGNAVGHRTAEGKDLGVTVPGLERPTAISFDLRGRLLVCDDGRRQQVLTFDVTGRRPERVAAFGDEGGLLSGTPGRVAPRKLLRPPRGGHRRGRQPLRRHGVRGHSGGQLRPPLVRPDPASCDGSCTRPRSSTPSASTPIRTGPSSTVGPRSSTWTWRRRKPGAEATLRAITLDHVNHPEDDRIKYGCSVVVRNLGGRRLVYMIGQYGGGYRLYTFDEPDGQIARQVDRIHPEGETWAWDVDDDGGIWHGDAAGQDDPALSFPGLAARRQARLRLEESRVLAMAGGFRAGAPRHLREGHRLALSLRLPEGPADRVVGRRRPDCSPVRRLAGGQAGRALDRPRPAHEPEGDRSRARR